MKYVRDLVSGDTQPTAAPAESAAWEQLGEKVALARRPGLGLVDRPWRHQPEPHADQQAEFGHSALMTIVPLQGSIPCLASFVQLSSASL